MSQGTAVQQTARPRHGPRQLRDASMIRAEHPVSGSDYRGDEYRILGMLDQIRGYHRQYGSTTALMIVKKAGITP